MERTKKQRVLSLTLLAVVCLVGALFIGMRIAHATPYTIADDIGGSVGLGTADLKTTVINIIKWVLGILALVAVSFILYGGFIWLTSAGNVERIQKAKRIIINAVIGLVIVLISWAIVIFVTKFITGATSGGGPGTIPCVPGDLKCPFPKEIGLEIRSITTDCEDADLGDYRHKVFICSAVNITFNHTLTGVSVKAAVDAGTFKVEECSGVDGAEHCADAAVVPTAVDSALDGVLGNAVVDPQPFVDVASGTFPSDIQKGASWAAHLDNSGKNVTFFHVKTLYEKNMWFRVSIPKSIIDTKAKNLSDCRKDAMTPLDGCFDDGGAFTWTMLTGDKVDTERPVITSAYPDTRYLKNASFDPDRSVPLTPTINLHYNKAILPPTSVSITPFTTAPNPADGTGGVLGAALASTDYTVYPGGDGRSIFIQMKQHDKCDTGGTKLCLGGSKVGQACSADTDCPDFKMLEKFTWYKASIGGVIDLCSNLQDPDPFAEPPQQWVFETNDVVPNATVYPPDGYPNSCPSTPAFIRYTVSMYSSENDSCTVAGAGGGHVIGYEFKTKAGVPSGKEGTIRIDDPCPGGVCSAVNPANYCKVYSFPVTPNLTPDTTYDVAMANDYIIDDKATTLSWGTTTAGSSLWAAGDYNGDAKKGWEFSVKKPGECADPPVITWIDPPKGTDGQCVTVHGYNFDGNKDGALRDGTGSAGDVDDLQYEGANVPDANLGKWSDVQVGAEVPAGGAIGSKTFKVKSKFPDPFGILESTDTVPNWEKINGPASTAACLLSLEPDKGIVGSMFTATGKRFDPGSTTKSVHFDTVSPLPYKSWTDTKITELTVPNVAPNIYPVWVENDKGDSNSLNYEVTPIPPGQPVVVDHYPACSTSCIGADIGAEFYDKVPVDSATLNDTTAKLLQCNDDKCTTFVGPVAVTVNPGPSPTTVVKIVPNASLLAGKWYRVVLTDAIKGATSPNDGTLGGLNYDLNGDSKNDSFSWTFKTAAIGAEGCKLDRVEVIPASFEMHALNETKIYRAESYTEPNACSASGQKITTSTNWSPWTSTGTSPPRAAGTEYITLSPSTDPWLQLVTAKNESVPDKFTVEAHGDKDGIAKNGAGTLATDFSYCNDDATCQKGGACPESVCDKPTHRCTPDITSFSPDHGDIGTWVGISGCYFGNYVRGTCVLQKVGERCDTDLDCFDNGIYGVCVGGSRVIFTSGKNCLWPDQKMCGPINWSNTYILAEVPNRVNNNDAVDGPFRMSRWDNKTANTSTDYNVDSTKMPGICLVQPVRGATGTKVTLTGQNFGAVQNMSKVYFYKDAAGPAESTPVASWSDSKVVTPAPANIANNPDVAYIYPVGQPAWGPNHEIRMNVVAGTSEWSNTKDFEVVPPGCVACVVDTDCAAGKACGYGGCCADIPSVIDKQPVPDSVNVCRNSLVSAKFDMAMDPTTISKSTAHLYRFDDVVKGNVDVQSAKISYDKKSYTMSIDAGLLERNTTYSVSLSEGGELVKNGNFEDGSGTFPTGWTGMAPAYAASFTQSPDISNQVTPGTKSLHIDTETTKRCDGNSGTLAGNLCNNNNDCNTVNPLGKCVAPSLYAYQFLDGNSTQKRSFRVTGWVRLRNTANPFSAVGGLITQCWSTVAPYKTDPWAPPCDQNGKTFDLYGSAPGLITKTFGQDSGWVHIDYTITNNTGANIAPKILCFATPGTDVWCDEVSVKQVGDIKKIRSAAGAALPPTQWSFKTADMEGACKVSRVGVEPSNWTFWTADPTKKASGKDFKAHAYSDTGIELAEVPGMLEWSWGWYIKNGSPFGFTDPADVIHPQTPGFPDVDTAVVRALPAKGKGSLLAVVNPIPKANGGPIGQTAILNGISTITVNACNNPWFPINEDTYGYVDSNSVNPGDANRCTIVNPGAVCSDYHFNIGYCRDLRFLTCKCTTGKETCDSKDKKCTGGVNAGVVCSNDNQCPEQLLPDLKVMAVTQYKTEAPSSKPVLLKEFLFKEQTTETKDAIGMRIYDNVEGLSVLEWYKKYANKARASPEPKTIDGYDAIKDGTAVYVGGSDLADLDGKLHSKIFILSYNAGADAKIISIYDQMLASWFFNNNTVLSGVCDNALPEDQRETLKVCAQRDLKRVAGLSDIIQYLRAYKATSGAYPKLLSGSYIANMSFSVWPSWKNALGGDLKESLPVDPKNRIENCPSTQSQDGSCWSETNKTFICKNDALKQSHVYGYYSNGTTANLYANLEYSGPGSWITNPVGTGPPCPAGSDCNCFNYVFGP